MTSGCHKGPLHACACKSLSLLHLDDLALAQLKGEWLQQMDRILVRLKCSGLSCWPAKQARTAQRPCCWQDAGSAFASSQHRNAACWQVKRALQQRRPAYGQSPRAAAQSPLTARTWPLSRLLSNFLPLLARVPV